MGNDKAVIQRLSKISPSVHNFPPVVASLKKMKNVQRNVLAKVNCKMWFLIVGTLALQSNVKAYNFDTKKVLIFTDPNEFHADRQSYFGFSTALYVASSGEPLLIVGAPRSNTSTFGNITEPGVIYKCSINKSCREWILDKSGNSEISQYPSVRQIKDNAWIGGTIAVENKTNPRVVICGPRWKNNLINWNQHNWFMNGICYSTVATGIESFDKEADNIVLPFVDPRQQIVPLNNIGVYYFGMGQAGFSVHIPPGDENTLFAFGSPGIYFWHGAPSLMIKQSNGYLQNIVPSIKREKRVRSGDFFGYTITSGCYFNKEERWYAAGAPRSENIIGKVFIFSFPRISANVLNIKKILQGPGYGEYFGSALATCDINNDEKDDLIVGAPLWSKESDEGRIYVYLGQSNDNFEMQSIDGESMGGRFGSAITCLGDVDYDSYGDIAVGAPYEDESGVVYIFNGNKNGLSLKHSQKIVGRHFHPEIRGFGISISEPRDVNADKYSDIVVGAYLSGHSVLIRSIPTVTVSAKFFYSKIRKLQRNSTFFDVELCASYDGAFAPETLGVLTTLKIDKEHGRAHYSKNLKKNDQLSHVLQKAKTTCVPLEIQIRDNIQNVIDPIEMSFSLALDNSTEIQDSENFSCRNCAVINKMFSETVDVIKLPFSVDCGDDNVCHSNLAVTISSSLKHDERYVIGSGKNLALFVNVTNRGEPAYQAKLKIYIPESLSLASLDRECRENARVKDALEVICDIGNPLTQKELLPLELDMNGIRFDEREVMILVNVTTQSEEVDTIDNVHNLTIFFETDFDIAVVGKPQEDSYSYFQKVEEKKKDLITFQHFYEVQNFGVSLVETAMLSVLIPTHWNRSNDLMEIAKIKETIAHIDGRQIYCDIFNNTEYKAIPSVTKFPENGLQKNESKLRDPKQNQTYEKLIIQDEISINIPPESRTLYINCSNSEFLCKRIECSVGPFTNMLSIAKLFVTMDLQLLNIRSATMENKDDIIFFVSEGNVNILYPSNVTQKLGHKADNIIVGTTFVGSPIAEKIAIWIIILSVLVGIVLLILLIFGLFKLGFFNRKKKQQLKALKAETDQRYSTLLEATASSDDLSTE